MSLIIGLLIGIYVWRDTINSDFLQVSEFIIRTSPQIRFDVYRNKEYQLIWFEYNTDRVGVKMDRWPELNLSDENIINSPDISPKLLFKESIILGQEKRVWMLENVNAQIIKASGRWLYINGLR